MLTWILTMLTWIFKFQTPKTKTFVVNSFQISRVLSNSKQSSKTVVSKSTNVQDGFLTLFGQNPWPFPYIKKSGIWLNFQHIYLRAPSTFFYEINFRKSGIIFSFDLNQQIFDSSTFPKPADMLIRRFKNRIFQDFEDDFRRFRALKQTRNAPKWLQNSFLSLKTAQKA